MLQSMIESGGSDRGKGLAWLGCDTGLTRLRLAKHGVEAGIPSPLSLVAAVGAKQPWALSADSAVRVASLSSTPGFIDCAYRLYSLNASIDPDVNTCARPMSGL